MSLRHKGASKLRRLGSVGIFGFPVEGRIAFLGPLDERSILSNPSTLLHVVVRPHCIE